MNPFRHTVVAAGLGGAAAAALAFLLDHLGTDSRVTLGLCLATFGVLEKLVLDARRSQRQRRVLHESLESFFRSMGGKERTQPLWTELQRQICALHDIEIVSERRELLRQALSEAALLCVHTSFLAITEHEAQSLLRLKKSLE